MAWCTKTIQPEQGYSEFDCMYASIVPLKCESPVVWFRRFCDAETLATKVEEAMYRSKLNLPP